MALPRLGSWLLRRTVFDQNSDILDAAVLAAFRQWHFKPGVAKAVKVPEMFTMDGVFTDYHVNGNPWMQRWHIF